MLAALIVTVQLPVPVHAPDQPVNVELTSGVAVKLIDVPELYVPEQVVPHEMPAGVDETVPVPVPDFVTERL